eukprot:Trichotokara_eunicae@DN396_c0_g1_i1.p1
MYRKVDSKSVLENDSLSNRQYSPMVPLNSRIRIPSVPFTPGFDSQSPTHMMRAVDRLTENDNSKGSPHVMANAKRLPPIEPQNKTLPKIKSTNNLPLIAEDNKSQREFCRSPK